MYCNQFITHSSIQLLQKEFHRYTKGKGTSATKRGSKCSDLLIIRIKYPPRLCRTQTTLEVYVCSRLIQPERLYLYKQGCIHF